MVIAGKCDSTTCTTLTSDLDIVKACFNDPTDTSTCQGILLYLSYKYFDPSNT